MERRDFFRLMLGAAAMLPPSQVWPFRKIFIPSWLGQEMWSTTLPVTVAHPQILLPGDRVKIYRTAAGLDGLYYVVDEIDHRGKTITFKLAQRDVPLPDWVSKGETLWTK